MTRSVFHVDAREGKVLSALFLRLFCCVHAIVVVVVVVVVAHMVCWLHSAVDPHWERGKSGVGTCQNLTQPQRRITSPIPKNFLMREPRPSHKREL